MNDEMIMELEQVLAIDREDDFIYVNRWGGVCPWPPAHVIEYREELEKIIN